MSTARKGKHAADAMYAIPKIMADPVQDVGRSSCPPSDFCSLFSPPPWLVLAVCSGGGEFLFEVP